MDESQGFRAQIFVVLNTQGALLQWQHALRIQDHKNLNEERICAKSL
jgi:hypothetical protein